ADPSQRVEKQLTETYQSTGGSMEAMLRTLVASDEFWKADSRWSLIKSPTHLAVGACRQLEIKDPPIVALSAWVSVSGHRLLDAPNFGGEGGPGQDAWLSPADRLASRYQLGKVLLGDAILKETAVDALAARLDAAPGIDTRQIARQVAKTAPDARVRE